ncbi:MAG: hypothetical protein Q9209_005409 [Squamulea sp. 1 TL-2023]
MSRSVRGLRKPILKVQGKGVASLAIRNNPWAGLKISRGRLMNNIHAFCEWGQGPRWGPLALSDADKEARDCLVHATKSLGCKVTVDQMGNIFAVRPGRRGSFPPTCAGSHLDTQPTGGRYDGILGVCAGLEMLNVLHEQKIETNFPVGVVNWTNEEGARFPISMVSSGVWAGEFPLEKAHSLKEVGNGGRTMRQELERIGYLGPTDANYQAMPLGAHFELHIADALLTAAKLILHSRLLAVKYDALASTGIIQAEPGSTNTVPGRVQFSLDIRAGKDDVLLDLEKHLKSDFDLIMKGKPVNSLKDGLEIFGKPCTIEWRLDAPCRATRFDDDCISCVRQSAEDLLRLDSGAEVNDLIQEMISGAGMILHDSDML